MKWWKIALINTGILLLLVAGLGFGLGRQIHKTSASEQEENARDNKLGTLCGEIFGAGGVIIWVLAYKKRDPS